MKKLRYVNSLMKTELCLAGFSVKNFSISGRYPMWSWSNNMKLYNIYYKDEMAAWISAYNELKKEKN